MKELIINDRKLGCCTAYRQNRTAVIPCWMFAMSEGYEVIVPFYMIKSFDSSGEFALELTLHNVDIPATTEKEA